MRKVVLYGSMAIVLFIAITTLFTGVQVQSDEQDHQKVSSRSIDLPEVSAYAWAIFDTDTGEILYGDHIEEKLPIASVTKLIIAAFVYDAPYYDTIHLITHQDIVTEGDSGRLWYGEEMSMYELLYPLLLESSNDAARAIERTLDTSFSEEVENYLNDVAVTETRITDASGLSPNNISTARDLARIYSFIKKHDQHVLDITQLETYVGSYRGYLNNNPAQKYKSFLGGKQGYLPEAGYTFLGAFTTDYYGDVGVILLRSDALSDDLARIYHFIQALQ